MVNLTFTVLQDDSVIFIFYTNKIMSIQHYIEIEFNFIPKLIGHKLLLLLFQLTLMCYIKCFYECRNN